MSPIIIIGAGWSGLAAAVTLSQQGVPVQVIESAKQIGGRARRVQWGYRNIDNGQHLMIGAYHRLLNMMQIVGLSPDHIFTRQAIHLPLLSQKYSPLTLTRSSYLPWPLSMAWPLFRHGGLSLVIAAFRIQRHIPQLLQQQDCSVIEWLQYHHQPMRLIEQLWAPLCLATLNTPIERASAHVFATVIHTTLNQQATDADLLIPNQDLTAIFPDAAAAYIQQRGGQVITQQRIQHITINRKQFIITGHQQQWQSAQLIIATDPHRMQQLLAPHIDFPTPSYAPIVTVYLQYPSHCQLPDAITGLTGTLSQWVFDKHSQYPGLFAVVISGKGPHIAYQQAQLVAIIATELHQHFPQLPAMPNDAFVIREKRATFECSVAAQASRPRYRTSQPGLWLTNDYIKNHYPATLEGAIQNGQDCVNAILASLP